MELAKTLVTITYKNALAALRNHVNHKIPPELSYSDNRKTRRINKAGTCRSGRGGRFQDQVRRCPGRGGRGRSGGRGRGRSGRRENNRQSRQDTQMVDAMTDQNWRFTSHINSLTINDTVYLRQKE